MEWVFIGMIVIWAIVHTYMDMDIKKRVEMLEKDMKAQKT